MATTPDTNSKLGVSLGNDVEVFRAFAEKNWRKRKNPPPHKATHYAFLLRADDLQNGLSLGLTERAAVSGLERNEGYCGIRTNEIRAVNAELDIRIDNTDPQHAFITNLPYMKESDEKRKLALDIARDIARAAYVYTCDSFIPNGSPPPVRE